ncbi:MAG: phage terminase large subunit [Pseudohongiellaceae bacterium]
MIKKITQADIDAVLRTDLTAFIEKSFYTVSPGTPYNRNWHIAAIAHQLERCRRGECKRLLITMPPRCLKSVSTNVAFPAYLLGHAPSAQIMCLSYGQDLSYKHGDDMRHLMNQDWYKSLFPKTRIMKSSQDMLVTTQKGQRINSSVGGAITGLGAEYIIIDDAHKADEGNSETKRQAVIDWYRHALLSRLNNKEDGVIIVIQQRLHEEDLAGYLIETGGFEHLNLPAIAIEAETIALGNDKVKHRQPGDLLDKVLLSQKVLDDLQVSMGSYVFAAQYQQEPAPVGGGMVKWEWFKIYKKRPPVEYGDRFIQSWDTAMTAKDSSDFSVCTTWQVKPSGRVYLLHVYRKKLEYPNLFKAAKKLVERFSPDLILIEASAAGYPLAQDLREYPQLLHRVKTVKPEHDKVTRMMAYTPILENGIVYVDKTATWLPDFHRELTRFPNTKHDDQVDSVSQFLMYYKDYMPKNPHHFQHPQAQSQSTPVYSHSHLPDKLFPWE